MLRTHVRTVVRTDNVKTVSLWHNSLITISIFREFRTQTIHQSYNLFVNYLDEDIPAMFRGILHTGSVENCNEIF